MPIRKLPQPTPTKPPTCAYNRGMNNGNDMNNLYILNEVLYDYTDGMAVIAAPSLERAWELFAEEFGESETRKAHNHPDIKVIEGVNHPEGVVSYVYGGG